MPETLEKLRPDRDLQCYFERPSAIAAMSGASASGFTISGAWRQQFDWAVIEWNRDNVFEHPALRNLPDGDLSGLSLSYEETRGNSIPMDSDLFPTVDWPYLRVWAAANGAEDLYKVRLADHATPIEGEYLPATAEFELLGTPTTGDYVGLAWLDEHHTYQLYAIDTLETAVQALVDSVNTYSATMRATRTGQRIKLTYVGVGQTLENSKTGANGNRIGVYGYVAGAKTESWSPEWRRLSGGTSPSKWRVELNLGSLTDIEDREVPAQAVRKMRWTYSADFQMGGYERSEFAVVVSNWSVTGQRRAYQIAGPGSRRIEDDATELSYSGGWSSSRGNFSGGSIRYTTAANSSVACTYRSPQTHLLLLGARACYNAAQISITVDGGSPVTKSLRIAGEDVLVRMPLGEHGPGEHTVTVSHQGTAGDYFYFDFVEIAIAASQLPSFREEARLTLATDWDTDHSIALAPERTAWLLHALGFHGRANHYVGALWFYELVRQGHEYASATVDFAGTPQFSAVTQLIIGRTDEPPEKRITLSHLNKIGDTAESVARAFELEINRGYTAIRAEVEGARLTIYARAMGLDGNHIMVAGSPTSGPFTLEVSGETLGGGADGNWRTDLAASPRLNRAARDWSRSYCAALKGYGIDAAAAFSMELQHGDPSVEAGIAQRYPSGDAALLTTPALQTNFSPTSLEFWKQVYLDMAQVMAEAGQQPFLQFGEVEWWYFPQAGSGMPFYDAYTLATFQARYGRAMQVISSNTADPALYPGEVVLLPELIGEFTGAIVSFVKTVHPACRFEVLYPTDVNDTPLNRLINYPQQEWTPEKLDCLKTESFTYTYARNLDLSRTSMRLSATRGFANAQRSHLVGIGDYTTAWLKEVRLAQAEGTASVVLFALDQFCLIGYPAPLASSMRRSVVMG